MGADAFDNQDRVHDAGTAMTTAIAALEGLPGYTDIVDELLDLKMRMARGPYPVAQRQIAEENAFEVAAAFDDAVASVLIQIDQLKSLKADAVKAITIGR